MQCIFVCFFFFNLVLISACGFLSCSMQKLVPWPGMENRSPALRAQSLNHWTTRKVPQCIFKDCLKHYCVQSETSLCLIFRKNRKRERKSQWLQHCDNSALHSSIHPKLQRFHFREPGPSSEILASVPTKPQALSGPDSDHLLFSCSVMSDSLWPMDSSPPGSSLHGILQARYWSGLPFPPPGRAPYCLTFSHDSFIKLQTNALLQGASKGLHVSMYFKNVMESKKKNWCKF